MTFGLLPPSKPVKKKAPGITGAQWFFLASLGVLFCFLVVVFIGFMVFPEMLSSGWLNAPASPRSDFPLPAATQPPSPTQTPTFTASPSPTPSLTPTPTPGAPLPPDTSDGIHLALIFNGGVSDPREEVGIIDLVWGSEYPNQPEGVYNLYYYPFDRDADGDTGGLAHDITWFEANHPDWIEYTCDQRTPAYEYGDPNVPLDITNPEVIDYMMETYLIPAIREGYQGIAFDNVDFNNNGFRCGIWKDGVWVEQSNYIENILTWAEDMYSRLHALNVAVAMNFPYDTTHPVESSLLYQYLDIAVDERGFTNWGREQSDYLSGSEWLDTMQAFISLDEAGKGFVSINQLPKDFDQATPQEIQWILANYLMAKGRYSYVSISGVQEYGRIFTIPEYEAKIGRPRSVMYQSQNVFMRDYSHGMVIVNPSSRESYDVILIPNTYLDLYGNPVDALTLEPQSGIVLLKKSFFSWQFPSSGGASLFLQVPGK